MMSSDRAASEKPPSRFLDLEVLKHESISATGLDPHLALVRTWQSERLGQTYADLLADPRYQPACQFFLTDIYAARDFSQRDHDVARIHALLSSVLPPRVVQVLTDIITLMKLTNALDNQLVQVLVNRLDVTDSITAAQYREGYRLCDNYDERMQQIELVTKILSEVGQLAHTMMIGVGLKLVRVPAERAGWSELYGFLERGYAAFKPMRNVSFFVQTVEEREKRLLNEIWTERSGADQSSLEG
jgi:chorismate mutase